LKDKAVWFLRILPPDAKRKPLSLTELIWGEITPNTVPHLNSLMENVYSQFISLLGKDDWGVCEEESKKEFLSHTEKFAEEVKESIKLMSPGQELFKLDPEESARIQASTNDAEKLLFYEGKFTKWI